MTVDVQYGFYGCETGCEGWHITWTQPDGKKRWSFDFDFDRREITEAEARGIAESHFPHLRGTEYTITWDHEY